MFMANGKITKKLKKLGLTINGKEPSGNTISEVIESINNDFANGNVATKSDVNSVKTYLHTIEVTSSIPSETYSATINFQVISKYGFEFDLEDIQGIKMAFVDNEMNENNAVILGFGHDKSNFGKLVNLDEDTVWILTHSGVYSLEFYFTPSKEDDDREIIVTYSDTVTLL